jgi:hypothetical protein
MADELALPMSWANWAAEPGSVERAGCSSALQAERGSSEGMQLELQRKPVDQSVSLLLRLGGSTERREDGSGERM